MSEIDHFRRRSAGDIEKIKAELLEKEDEISKLNMKIEVKIFMK